MLSFVLPDNDPGSALTHFLGFVMALASLVTMVVIAAVYGSIWHVITYAIFGTSLALLYFVSSLYHITPRSHPARTWFSRLDRAMIYILIAGTYTPVCLIVLRGGWGWSLFGVEWLLAILGFASTITGTKLPRWFPTIMYIILGWLALVAFVPITRALSLEALGWLLSGGIFYTLGVVFFAAGALLRPRRWLGMHEIFHLFVVAGSLSHVWFMLTHVIHA